MLIKNVFYNFSSAENKAMITDKNKAISFYQSTLCKEIWEFCGQSTFCFGKAKDFSFVLQIFHCIRVLLFLDLVAIF